MEKIKIFLPIAICGLTSVLAIILLILYIRTLKKQKDILKELERQKERVIQRKNKIYQLKDLIRRLNFENQKYDERLKASVSTRDLQENYKKIIFEMRDILRLLEAGQVNEELSDAITEKVRQSAIDLRKALMIPDEEMIDVNPESAVWDDQKEKETAGPQIIKHVLFADDNQENLDHCAEMLEMAGYAVDKVLSGEEAFKLFRVSEDGYYSIVYLDIVMTGKNGYEVAGEIRSLGRVDSEKVPIIAVTANNFTEDVISIQSAGMNDRVVKPITETKLIEMNNKWLNIQVEKESSPTVQRIEDDSNKKRKKSLTAELFDQIIRKEEKDEDTSC